MRSFRSAGLLYRLVSLPTYVPFSLLYTTCRIAPYCLFLPDLSEAIPHKSAVGRFVGLVREWIPLCNPNAVLWSPVPGLEER